MSDLSRALAREDEIICPDITIEGGLEYGETGSYQGDASNSKRDKTG